MTGPLQDQAVLVIGRGSGIARAVTIAALGKRVGTVGHVISTASARARGRVADPDRDAIRRSFDTKVIGPLMLAKHLAPIRVSAISPGVIDTGAWDALGDQGKADYFADLTARNPARRIGSTDGIANGVPFALTSTFLTGQTLHIDGGEPLT